MMEIYTQLIFNIFSMLLTLVLWEILKHCKNKKMRIFYTTTFFIMMQVIFYGGDFFYGMYKIMF